MSHDQAARPAKPIETAPSGRAAGIWLLLFAVGVAVECLLFVQTFHRDVSWGYPLGYDQSTFLMRSYSIYEEIKVHGLSAGLWHGFWAEAPSGVLLAPAGALAMYLFGPTRIACLAVNMMLLVLAQFAFFIAWKRHAQAFSAGLAALGLFVMTSFPFFWAGGLLDFRQDLSGVCLFAIFISAVVGSDFFAQRRGALLAAGIAVVMICTRFITVTYFAGVTVGCALYQLWLVRRGRKHAPDSPERSLALARLKNLALTVGVAAACTMPILVHNVHAMFNYYGTGHVLGVEKQIRAREWGIANQLDSWLFYPKSVLRSHLGQAAAWATGLLALGSLVIVAAEKMKRPPSAPRPPADRSGLVFLLLCVVVPDLVLTKDVSKSPVVGAIMVPPIIALGALAFARLRPVLVPRYLARVVAAVILGAGLLSLGNNMVRPGNHSLHPAHAAAVDATYSALARLAEKYAWAQPRLAFTGTNDSMFSQALNAWYYEKHGRMLEARDVLGGGIFAQTQAEIINGLDQANIIALWKASDKIIYPFQQSIADNWDAIRDYCSQRAVPSETIRFPDFELTIYYKARFVPPSISGGWITEQGIAIAASLFPPGPRGVLLLNYKVPGFVNFRGSPPLPEVSLMLSGAPRQPLPFELTSANGITQLRVPLEGLRREAGDQIQIKFSRYFIPKSEGINEDERHLCVEFIGLDLKP